MKIQNNQNNINFKGIEKHLVSNKETAIKVSEMLLKKVEAGKSTNIIDSPGFNIIRSTIAKLKNPLWVKEHLELKGIEINLPKSITEEKDYEMFFITGDTFKKYKKEVLGGNITALRFLKSLKKTVSYLFKSHKVTKSSEARNFLMDYALYCNYKQKFNKFIEKYGIDKTTTW